MIGPRAFAHQTDSSAASPTTAVSTMDLTTACELFVSDDERKLACIQLRAPFAPALLQSFFEAFEQFLLAQQVSELVILTSSFAHEQHRIEESKFSYLANDAFRQRTKALSVADDSRWSEWQRDEGQLIHGSGFALKLWQHLETKLPVCLLFKYISEGDNRIDAIQLLDRLDQLLSGKILKNASDDGLLAVKEPVSWKALYGNEPSEQLY